MCSLMPNSNPMRMADPGKTLSTLSYLYICPTTRSSSLFADQFALSLRHTSPMHSNALLQTAMVFGDHKQVRAVEWNAPQHACEDARSFLLYILHRLRCPLPFSHPSDKALHGNARYRPVSTLRCLALIPSSKRFYIRYGPPLRLLCIIPMSSSLEPNSTRSSTLLLSGVHSIYNNAFDTLHTRY